MLTYFKIAQYFKIAHNKYKVPERKLENFQVVMLISSPVMAVTILLKPLFLIFRARFMKNCGIV